VMHSGSKQLQELFKVCQHPNKMEELKKKGSQIPPILNFDLTTPLNKRNLDQLHQAPDNLHNLKGVAKVLIKYEQENTKTWDETKFLMNVAKYLHRSGISQMKGSLWRLLVVNYESIILPSITDLARRDKIRTVFSFLAEIQAIAYAEPIVQQQKCVRLRLHVLCFLLGVTLQKTHPKLSGSGMLYVHTVITHFPISYENHDFRNGSTEAGEGFLAICKSIVLRFTSRKTDESLIEIFVRRHYENKVKQYCGKHSCGASSEISATFSKHKFSELFISASLASTNNDDISLFLAYLNKLGYDNSDFWITTTAQPGIPRGSVCFNTMEAKKFLIIKE